jgi:hypothetical protein
MGPVYESRKQLKGWISSYLNRKGLSDPNGLPLYSYSTTDNELQFLSAALAVNAEERHGLISRKYWAAGYCLFVSEKYRREYEASWSWQAFDAELGIKLQPSEHTKLVKLGLGFWDRPIRYRTHGADYLGSLFAEGGVPWRLLQNEQHGFGRAIKAGLKHYHECKRDGWDLVQVIREYGHYFPQSFQNVEKYQLLASIAETLMVLAEQHRLDQQEDPASFLNRHVPQWRDEFPLPLEEDNGFALVNEWLRDAGSRLEERKRAEEMARQFTCEHQLDGPMESACLQAKVWLSRSLQIKLGARKIITSRVELALYEGDRLALKLGVAYGRLEGDVLTIKMPSEVAKLRRQSPEKPLFVVSSCAGERLDTHAIQSSEIDWNQLPTVFVEEDDVTRLVGIASVKCKAPEVLLRIPACVNSQGGELLINDVEGGAWHRIDERLTISDSGSRYVVEPGNSSDIERVELQGVISSYDTLPVTTWLGWPRCLLINSFDEGYQPDAFRVDEQLVKDLGASSRVGSFKVDILGADKRVIARRKLGVLPRDFSIAAMPASSQVPARILISTIKPLNVRVLNDGLSPNIRKEGSAITVQLTAGKQKPDRVLLEITDERTSAAGVVIRLPYPEEGAQLLESDGQMFLGRGLTLERTLGMTLVFTPPPDRAKTFYLSLELMGQTTKLEKQYSYHVNNTTAQVSLYSLYDDILSLLSCSAEQDATIRCRVETSQMLRQFYIHRYDAAIKFTNEFRQFFELLDHSSQPLMHRSEGTTVMAMQVHTPKSQPIAMHPQSSNGVITGFYALPDKLQKDGPWLLYPEESSPIAFRPAIHVPDFSECELEDIQNIKTLHSAARYYHPQHRPDVFDVVLDDMAGHFLHNSWLYLIELKQHYRNIPLSAFESWKHLARHPQAMALAVFRLEINSVFADRLKQELAVTWEAITIEQWRKAMQLYVEGVSQQFGIPAQMLQSKVRERMELLAVQVPVFKDLASALCDDNSATVSVPPLQTILPIWLGELRSRNEDAKWPTNLSEPLGNWIRQQEDYAWLTELPMPGYMHSVCFMPVFAAFLTAGVADLYELSADDAALRFSFRVLSDFDRNGWYEPVYSATLSGLLHAKGREL